MFAFSPDSRRSAVCAIAGSLLCAGALVAQANPGLPASLAEKAIPILEPSLPDGSSAGLWAGGRNYKVSFHDGMVYYPHVGPDLPHQPVRWRTTSVRVGGRELLAAGNRPSPEWRDYRCDYDLGPVVERYDVRVDGVEQSFVLTGPAGGGDIVITGEVITPLDLPEADARQGSLDLCLADGRTVVRYGEAVAFDAEGRRAPVLTSSDGTEVTLRLPGAFAADASYPLVIDPLLSNVLLETGAPIVGSDVLHETLSPTSPNLRTWVTYEQLVAAGDSDIKTERFGPGFAGAGTLVFTEITPLDSVHGRMALSPGSGKVVIVISSSSNPGSSFVWGHRHDVNDLTLQTVMFSISGTLGTDDFNPDIGGYEGGSEMLVVWRSDPAPASMIPTNSPTSAVYAAVIDPSIGTGSLVTVPEFVVRNRPNRDQERPTVNQLASGPEWLVAYQEHDPNLANDDWEVGVQTVDNLGIASAVVTTQDAGTIHHKMGPQLAGSDGRYLLTYTVRNFELGNPKPQLARGQSVYSQRIDWDHVAGTGSLPHPQVLLQSSGTGSLTAGGVAFDSRSDSHWCATVDDNAADNYTAYKLGYRGAVVENGVIGPAAGVDPAPGGVAFSRVLRDFLLVFGANDGSAGGNQLFGARMVYDPVAPPSTNGLSCGSGLFGSVAAMADRQQIGSEDLRFELVGAPADTFALMALSVRTANIPLGPLAGMPGCDLRVDPRPGFYLGTFFQTVSGGTAEFTIDLPESLAPATLHAQWIYHAPGANAADLQASEGVTVELGR